LGDENNKTQQIVFYDRICLGNYLDYLNLLLENLTAYDQDFNSNAGY